MKTSEVMRVLRVSRPTVYNYRVQGKLTGKLATNGSWNYDEESVYKLLNDDVPRKNYIYARVSTPKQKVDLDNQLNLLKQWCVSTGIQLHGQFADVASGISFEKRKDFFKLLDDVMDNKVSKVIITYKDRLSRVGFDLFHHLFKRFGTEIVVISEVGNPKLDSEEVFEEIVSLLHCYSMKLYSKRKRKVVEDLVSQGNGDDD
jgi:predicted site-specific integrase-resolvase